MTTQLTDPLGQTTPAGHTIVYHRDSNGLVSQATDRVDRDTRYTRDSKGNRTTIKWPDGNSVLFQFNSNSEVTQRTDELGRITTFNYDGSSRPVQVKQPDPDGGGPLTSPITTLTYTTDGNAESIQDARGNRTTFAYDSRDRVTQTTYPDDDGDATNNPKVTLTYDSASNVTERKDDRGNIVTMTYDDMGRTKTVKNQLGNVTTLTYDSAGNLTQVTRPDPDGAGPLTSPVTTLTYDMMNRLRTTVDALSNTTTLSYDNAGNIVTVTDPLSRTTTFTYNELSQRTVITEADPDGGGPLTSPVTTITYDAEGQIKNVRDPLNRSTTLTYSNRGWNETVTDALGTITTLAYDAVGNRTQRQDSGGSNFWTFDALDQVQTSKDGLNNVTTHTYDANGNLSLKSQISNAQKWEYSWDYRNRLTQVVVKDSSNNVLQQSDYTYDAFDRRIIKTYDPDGPGSQQATTTKTLYDGASFAANPYADFDGNNTLTMRYLYGPAVDMILARRDTSGIVAWYLADHLGTVRDLVNTSGTVLDHVSYSAYGKVTAESNSSNGDRFKFTGREYDSETGQHHYRARPYDGATGRFSRIDPIGFRAADSNLYRYVGNEPGRFTDPLGLQQQPNPGGATHANERRNAAMRAMANADGATNRSDQDDYSARRVDAFRSIIAGTGTAIQEGAPVVMEVAIQEAAMAGIPWGLAARATVGKGGSKRCQEPFSAFGSLESDGELMGEKKVSGTLYWE